MGKTRVPKGKHYFWIDYYGNEFGVFMDTDWRMECSNERYESGNYFLSSDDANKAVSKLRAVLKGAEVIEMPSEEEIKASQGRIEDEVVFNIRDANGSQLIYCNAINKGAELMADWLKSKIVK